MAAYLLPLGLHLNFEKEGQPNPRGNAEWQTKGVANPKEAVAQQAKCSVEEWQGMEDSGRVSFGPASMEV